MKKAKKLLVRRDIIPNRKGRKGRHISSKLELFMLENGKAASEMVMANSHGLTELSILENGERIEHTAKVDLFM
jgi:hypothetical protein